MARGIFKTKRAVMRREARRNKNINTDNLWTHERTIDVVCAGNGLFSLLGIYVYTFAMVMYKYSRDRIMYPCVCGGYISKKSRKMNSR